MSLQDRAKQFLLMQVEELDKVADRIPWDKLPKPVLEVLNNVAAKLSKEGAPPPNKNGKASPGPPPKKGALLGGVLAIASLLLWLLISEDLLLHLVGACYPLHASLKMLASGKLECVNYWLSYWVIFASFWLFTFFFDIILNLIPFMLYMKCGALLFLQMRGVDIVVSKVLKPYVYPLLGGNAPMKANEEPNGVKANPEVEKEVEKLLKEGNGSQ